MHRFTLPLTILIFSVGCFGGPSDGEHESSTGDGSSSEGSGSDSTSSGFDPDSDVDEEASPLDRGPKLPLGAVRRPTHPGPCDPPFPPRFGS